MNIQRRLKRIYRDNTMQYAHKEQSGSKKVYGNRNYKAVYEDNNMFIMANTISKIIKYFFIQKKNKTSTPKRDSIFLQDKSIK